MKTLLQLISVYGDLEITNTGEYKFTYYDGNKTGFDMLYREPGQSELEYIWERVTSEVEHDLWRMCR